MATTVFELISPERVLFSGEVRAMLEHLCNKNVP
jgi:hypothetical protein